MSLQKIAPQSGAGFILRTGQRLIVTDPMGQQVSDLFCVSLEDKEDVLSSGRSIDYGDGIYFSVGSKLYSTAGRVMLEIVADSCKTHDFLVTPCSLQMFQMMDPNCRYHPSCEENIINSLRSFNINKKFIPSSFNIFMNVPVSTEGKIKVEKPLSVPGDSIEFLAHMDLVVALTACSDEGTNAGKCKAIHYQIV